MIQKRKKAQFNLIDALIVIIILGLMGVATYLLFGGSRATTAPGNSDLTFEVRISNVKENALPYITEGLAVKNSVTGESLGTVTAIRTEKSRYYGGVYEDENGDYILSETEYPDEYDVYVTVSTSSKADDRGICSVGGVRMIIGEAVHFQVKSFSAVSYIVSVEFPNEEIPE